MSLLAKDWSIIIANDSNPALAECFIAEMEQGKRWDGKQHEFVQFSVQHGSGQNRPTTKLLTDRCIKDDTDSKRTSSILSTSASAPVSSPPVDPSSSMPPAGADDRVYCGNITHVLQKFTPFDTFRTVRFDDDSFSVKSLATLLRTVSLEEPDYKANENQCYWYADTVYSAAKELFHGTETIDPVHGKSRGKCFHIPIRQGKSIDAVVKKCRRIFKEEGEKVSFIGPFDHVR
jgi:hypothetical protein